MLYLWQEKENIYSRKPTGMMHDAARLSIPMSSGQAMQRRVPWWTNQCIHVTRERKLAQSRYQHTKRICNKIAYNRAHAVAQRTRLLARQTSWKDYVSTINSSTPMAKIWDRIANTKRIKYQPFYTITIWSWITNKWQTPWLITTSQQAAVQTIQ